MMTLWISQDFLKFKYYQKTYNWERPPEKYYKWEVQESHFFVVIILEWYSKV